MCAQQSDDVCSVKLSESMRYSPYCMLFVQFLRVLRGMKAKTCTLVGLLLQSVTCSFLGMEGGLTHIQGFPNNVEVFYPKSKSVPRIGPPANLDATSAQLV